MSKILIVGNVLKDVYLKLDERQNDFEKDEQGTYWLDLEFNGAAHSFFRRTSVFGGAAVSLSVLSRLGIDARIMGSDTQFKNGDIVWQDSPADYRYIFCHEGEIVYFVPSARQATDWKTPSGTPEWILVDRSTVVSTVLADEIKNFLKLSPSTKLAVHAEKRMTPAGRRLADMADVLFLEDEPPVHTEEPIVDKIDLGKPNTQLVCHISPRKIVLGDAEESWHLSRTDMLTHLTVYSTIVATVLGVISAGGSAADAVLWAKLNAEEATLESSLSARKLQELAKAETDKRANVRLIAKSLMVPQKGVLMADETDNALTERLVNYSIPATDTSRKAYRDLLLTAPELRNYLSGVVLSPQVAQQKAANGRNYLEMLIDQGLIMGVRADKGQAKLENTTETYALGTEGLAERLSDYYKAGFRMAAWRAKFHIAKDQPGFMSVRKNAELLADFAKECQLAGLVPLVESEIEYDGDYTIEQNVEATDRVLMTIFEKLLERRVDLGGVVLSPNMVIAGKQAVAPSTPREAGIATVAILKHAVPKYVAGILLMNGGQEAKNANKNLAAIHQGGPFDWPVSFAFSFEEPVMKTWKGKKENIKAAQAALKRHLEANSDAVR